MIADLLLAKLDAWRPDAGRHSCRVIDPTADWNATLTSERNDSLSTLLWELAVDRPAGTGSANPAAWAKRLAENATGLLEPLRVLEVDTTQGEAVLRSVKPSRRGDALFYYELHLYGEHQAVLRRFESSLTVATRRKQIPYVLTHEALGKLIDDLVH